MTAVEFWRFIVLFFQCLCLKIFITSWERREKCEKQKRINSHIIFKIVFGNSKNKYCWVHSGYGKKYTSDWMAYKQQKFISHSSGGWTSEIRVATWLDSSEALFQVADSWLLAVSSHGRKRALWSPFHKGTKPIHEGSPLMI